MATDIEHLVNSWIQDAYQRGASDIHFEPDKNDKIRVRMRVDGRLRATQTVADGKKVLTRLKIMADLDISDKGVPMDGRINFERFGKGCPGLDLRMSTLPCLGGEKVVLRLVDKRKLGMTLDQLGFTKKMLKIYQPLAHSPHGLILHVGPTGSGKTTSLYAIVQTLKSGDLNIQTAEDPIEYDVFGITQTAINRDAGLNFPRILRALLRQDPDVILVGEIRDAETAEIATEAAMTGHLVLSTLHTNDAVGTVVRLMDMGIAPFCISYALKCVVSQRFARRLCETCRRSTEPSAAIRAITGSPRPVYSASGCSACGRTGYKGRVPLFELLPNSPALRKAVFDVVTPDMLGAVAAKNGLISLWQDGLDKAFLGTTSLEEVLRVVRGVKGGVKQAAANLRAQQKRQAAAGRRATPRKGPPRPAPVKKAPPARPTTKGKPKARPRPR